MAISIISFSLLLSIAILRGIVPIAFVITLLAIPLIIWESVSILILLQHIFLIQGNKFLVELIERLFKRLTSSCNNQVEERDAELAEEPSIELITVRNSDTGLITTRTRINRYDARNERIFDAILIIICIFIIIILSNLITYVINSGFISTIVIIVLAAPLIIGFLCVMLYASHAIICSKFINSLIEKFIDNNTQLREHTESAEEPTINTNAPPNAEEAIDTNALPNAEEAIDTNAPPNAEEAIDTNAPPNAEGAIGGENQDNNPQQNTAEENNGADSKQKLHNDTTSVPISNFDQVQINLINSNLNQQKSRNELAREDIVNAENSLQKQEIPRPLAHSANSNRMPDEIIRNINLS